MKFYTYPENAQEFSKLFIKFLHKYNKCIKYKIYHSFIIIFIFIFQLLQLFNSITENKELIQFP